MTIETVTVNLKAFNNLTMEMAKNDQQTNNIQATGFYERHTLFTIARGKHSRGYRNFIDIGANMGYYTAVFSKISPNGVVYSFEPNPDVLPILRGNIERNQLTNVKLFEIGLGDQPTEMTLYSSHQNTGTTSVYQIPQHDVEHQIKISTLDHEIPGTSTTTFDFIKIDIQGHDLPAMNGGRDIIKRDLPDIMIEYGPMEINLKREELLETFIFLSGYGYDPYIYRAHDFSCIEILNFEILMNLFDLYKINGSKGGFHVLFMSRLRDKNIKSLGAS